MKTRIILLFFFFYFAFSFAKTTPTFPFSTIINRPNGLSASSAKAADNHKLYDTKYFTQILDHFTFTPQSYHTFQQRYLINDRYWGGAKNMAPIFVYMGNEGDIEWFTQNTGFMFDIAPHFNALLVFIEHRFYGKSVPFGGEKEAKSSSKTLGYLSSTQVLADYATLIIDLKKNLTATDSPVVVFGGSYGGMLAAWFRLKYPHVTIGALASSAPILYFENITSPYAFSDVITQDFRSESENCYKVIKSSWQFIEDTAKQAGGPEILEKSFRICKNNISADSLENWLYTAYAYTAMTDYPTAANFLNPLPPYPVKQMCKAIDDPRHGSDILEKLYAAVNIFYNYTGEVNCFDPEKPLEVLSRIGVQWRWQTCTEIIIPVGASSKDSIFPASEWNYSENAKFCKNAFNIEPRPNWITTEFGAHNIKRVLKRFGSNIIFFNGLRDPWSSGGVLENISKSIVAIVAKEGAHHVDLRFSTKEDPKWLKDVRRKEVKIIHKWISQYYHK
ncbi:PREDICTED: lysosomal Pro-X carboxypeptidase-like [Ipomoea nil]|uniref:lysosomal Pro-X carboxypeptidase-like n=1 Tax=Ipomoea nil TaxID=35883 RepID=UPI000900984A|nr:PREDICTED: lysosomal Pro-X carboxypeptidase-like [Ipomoea nil]XP_019153546.1 PREDICTED: lysosomal Pro-X carboxypeptidase-like [Ipomoea nil]